MHMVINTISKSLFVSQVELVVKALDYVMSLNLPELPLEKDYTDALKGFEAARLGELHRLALFFPDCLLVSKLVSSCCYVNLANDDSGCLW